jgi:hypothetical protein
MCKWEWIKTYKHQASTACTPSFAFLVNDRESHEEHVQQSIQDRHVQGNEEHNQLPKEQLQRPDQEDGQPLRKWPHIEILLSDVLVAASLLAQLFGAAGKDSRRVGLGHGEGDQNPHDKGEDELDPVQPAPACRIRQVPTDEGSDGRADERGGGEGGHRYATLLVFPQVGQRAAHKRHGRGEGDAVDGAADEQRADVLGYGTWDDEYHGDQECGPVNDPTAIDLRQRREDDGADTKTNDEEGDGEERDLLADAE